MAKLVGGQWLLFENADAIGYERWRVDARAAGGRRYVSEGGATFPQPHETRLTVETDEKDALTRLEIATSIDGEDETRRLVGTLEGGVLLYVKRRIAGHESEELVPLGERVLADFPSPILTTTMLRRLALADVGAAREFDAILVSPLTFELSKQRYGFERVPDETVRTGAGEFEARAFKFASLGTRWQGRVWTDEDLNVLKYEGSWDLVAAEES